MRSHLEKSDFPHHQTSLLICEQHSCPRCGITGLAKIVFKKWFSLVGAGYEPWTLRSRVRCSTNTIFHHFKEKSRFGGKVEDSVSKLRSLLQENEAWFLVCATTMPHCCSTTAEKDVMCCKRDFFRDKKELCPIWIFFAVVTTVWRRLKT